MTQLGGGTATANALSALSLTTLSTAQGAREKKKAVPKILVVLTDGASNNRAAVPGAAQTLKDQGVQIFSIGVGNAVEARAQSSSPVLAQHRAIAVTLSVVSRSVTRGLRNARMK